MLSRAVCSTLVSVRESLQMLHVDVYWRQWLDAVGLDVVRRIVESVTWHAHLAFDVMKHGLVTTLPGARRLTAVAINLLLCWS